jgi:hypothetical protein
MLQMFYLNVAKVDLDVAYVCNGYTRVQVFSGVLQVFEMHVCKCFGYFGYTLQVFYNTPNVTSSLSHEVKVGEKLPASSSIFRIKTHMKR